jgi:DNA polymerase
MAIEEFRHQDPETEEWHTRQGLRYDGKRNGVPGRVNTYGGALCENVVQAISRDLLADSMVRLAGDGAEIVLHVHDEPVIECDETDGPDLLAHVKATMRSVPAWAAGLPIDVEGFVCRRYHK